MILQLRAGRRTRRMIVKGYRALGAVTWLDGLREVFIQR